MKIAFKIKVIGLIALGMICFGGVAHAKSAAEIDASVNTALKRFEKEVFGSKDMISKAKGVLVLPGVIKAGFGFGGEYGTGALRIKGKTVAYYNIISGSFGLQLGAQVKDIYLLFMQDQALKNFRNSDGWKAGVDGSVALIKVGAAASIDTTQTNKPILAFVMGQKGLMYNLSIEGAKFNKIQPE